MRVELAPARNVPVGARARRGVRKGMFAQGVVVLFDTLPSLAQLSAALGDFEVAREIVEERPSWMGGDCVLLPWRREVNGIVQVDLMDRPWPDGMGSKEEADLLGAWAMGHFGVTTFPGALERATQHAFRAPQNASLAQRHKSFARVRLSYIFGMDNEAPVQPAGTDPIDELRFVSAVQLAVSALPGTLVLFNPSGELLVGADRLEAALRADAAGQRLPLDAWTNVRMFAPDDEHFLFDTPGLGQLDVIDHELVLPKAHASFPQAPGLLMSIAAYDAAQRGVLDAGETITDATGTTFTARAPSEAVVQPPRKVLRWCPDGFDSPSFGAPT